MANTHDLRIGPIERPEDFWQAFYCVREAFGRQAKDSVWIVMNPGWDTPDGQKHGAESFAEKWKSVTRNKEGDPNTVFLKATLPDPEDATRSRVVGMAIWKQVSFIEGHGDPPSADLGASIDSLDPVEKRFATQMTGSLWKRRIAYAKEKSNANPPAIFVLDMCAVDPAFQRRGIAQKLVQWGLDEAKRRGGLECTTEASSMGRGAYVKLGFKDEGVGDIVYDVDEEFKSRDKPPNIFLRTGISQ
jgi:ribosomal protein S18 acetylase RimI-like enzyme